MSDDKASRYWVGLLGIATAVFLAAVVVDLVQSMRAMREMYACEAQGLRYRRPTFTDEVICVPVVKEVGRE